MDATLHKWKRYPGYYKTTGGYHAPTTRSHALRVRLPRTERVRAFRANAKGCPVRNRYCSGFSNEIGGDGHQCASHIDYCASHGHQTAVNGHDRAD